MELADLPGHPARAIASRHKSLIEARLAEAFARGKIAAPAVTAREIWLLSEGAMMCMVLHGNPQYVTTAKRAALRLMRSSVRRVKQASHQNSRLSKKLTTDFGIALPMSANGSIDA